MKKKILLVGCGNMGTALLKVWINRGGFEIMVCHPRITPFIQEQMIAGKIGYVSSVQMALKGRIDYAVLAVKPSKAAEVLKHYKNVPDLPVFVSIMAGASVASLRKEIGSPSASVVRVMPNTPVQAGQGMTGCYADETVSDIHKQDIDALFSAAGRVVWLDEEDKINKMTAISGSGPAYFLHFVEALQASAETLGFDSQTASLLAKQTFIGAAEMLKQSNETATDLRKAVTSPNGTTEAALKVLINDALDVENSALTEMTKTAVCQAYLRAVELAD